MNCSITRSLRLHGLHGLSRRCFGRRGRNLSTRIKSFGESADCWQSQDHQLFADRCNEEPCELVSHYSEGSLMTRIFQGLHDAGINVFRLTARDLHDVDQFHTGGIVATNYLLSHMEKPKGDGCKVLDIGSGLGGTARHIALSWPESSVLGVDLTPEYVDAASQLTDLATDVDGSQCSFAVGSALDLPAGEEEFDAAVMLHVGMNVQDKKRLFAEASRVLKPGGQFGVFDVMLSVGNNNGHPCSQDLLFPVPWASDNSHSFLGTIADYTEAAEEAGFSIERKKCRRDFACVCSGPLKKKLLKSAQARNNAALNSVGFDSPSYPLAKAGFGDSTPEPFPLFSSMGITLGSNAALKMTNFIQMLEMGTIVPIEIVCVKDQ